MIIFLDIIINKKLIQAFIEASVIKIAVSETAYLLDTIN